MSKELKPNECKQIYDGPAKMFLIGCVNCGKPIKSWNAPVPDRTYKCIECQKKEAAETKPKDKLAEEIERLTQLQRLEKAKALIYRQGRNLKDYERAIKIIEPFIGRLNWFQNIGEMAVALELSKNKTKFNHQVQVGKYRANFVIPDLKVILEIDGAFHRLKDAKARDKMKDATMILSFGPEWEIIRISDELIKQNVQGLIPAIKQILSRRKWLRKKNKGHLPNKYSKQT